LPSEIGFSNLAGSSARKVIDYKQVFGRLLAGDTHGAKMGCHVFDTERGSVVHCDEDANALAQAFIALADRGDLPDRGN
jgi:hypothetical protein